MEKTDYLKKVNIMCYFYLTSTFQFILCVLIKIVDYIKTGDQVIAIRISKY